MENLKNYKTTDYWTIIFAIVFYYVNKLKNYEECLDSLTSNLQEISNQVIEKFNYLKEIYNLKIEIAMLKSKNKKAELSLLDLLKAIVAIIFIYVIVQIIKSFFAK